MTTKAQIRIMVFGTFDIVHPGHRNFFQQARSLAEQEGAEPYLIVSLSRTTNAERIKGKTLQSSESDRLARVQALPEVNMAMLGAPGNHVPHIVRQKPDIIALGYDQYAYVDTLEADLRAAGITPKIVRLQPFKPEKYKTSIIQAKQKKSEK